MSSWVMSWFSCSSPCKKDRREIAFFPDVSLSDFLIKACVSSLSNPTLITSSLDSSSILEASSPILKVPYTKHNGGPCGVRIASSFPASNQTIPLAPMRRFPPEWGIIHSLCFFFKASISSEMGGSLRLFLAGPSCWSPCALVVSPSQGFPLWLNVRLYDSICSSHSFLRLSSVSFFSMSARTVALIGKVVSFAEG